MRAVRRVDFGSFVRPAVETETATARVEPVLGHLVEHREGLVLVDTGMGCDPEVDAHYRPVRHPLDAALAGAGGRREDIAVVVNCHPHFEHCGANPEFGGTPIYVQTPELEAARREGYTLPGPVDAPGLRYEVLNGDAEVLPGVLVVPTPGHSPGHQSLVDRCDDGTVIVAGQTHTTATAFGADLHAWRTRAAPAAAARPVHPAWIDRLAGLDPRRVLSAHDRAVWEP